MVRVLIVEDCADYQAILSKMVAALGFDVALCDGGRCALEYLAKNEVDLVISDVQMPDGDGLWLLEQIRNRGASVPVVLISADVAREQAVPRGANGFLTKPFDMKTLKSVIDAVFEAT